jgi:RNA polymerase sigma-70 factor, ECF subfamily
VSASEDHDLLSRLRSRDEEAFVVLIDRYHGSMLRFAQSMAPNRAVAEEAVQDTWLGFLRGIDRFEGRSSLKTWLFQILVNRTRSAATRERSAAPVERVHTVDPSRFDSEGQWAEPVEPWVEDAEDRLDAATWLPLIGSALEALPLRQRQVVVLRDVEGLSNDETCAVLGISAGNERVLLHRGRAKLRDLLAAKIGKE